MASIFHSGDEQIEPATEPQLSAHKKDEQPKHNRERERNAEHTQQRWNRGRHEIVRMPLPKSEQSEHRQEKQQAASLQQSQENRHRQSDSCFVARVLKEAANVRCHLFRVSALRESLVFDASCIFLTVFAWRAKRDEILRDLIPTFSGFPE
jgi:hypothetical protein